MELPGDPAARRDHSARRAATCAATGAPVIVRPCRALGDDQRQRPPLTVAGRVHTEEVTGSVPVSPTTKRAVRRGSPAETVPGSC